MGDGRGRSSVAVAAEGGLGSWIGAERAVYLQSGQAVWMEPWCKGTYRTAAGGQRWWALHMTFLADQGEAVPVRKEWGVQLPGGGTITGMVRAYFGGATLAPAPTMQGHRGQDVVYKFWEEMTPKAAKTIKMTLEAHVSGCTCTQGTSGIMRSRGTTAWRLYHPCRSVCAAAQGHIGPRQGGRRMGARGGRSGGGRERQGRSEQWGPSGAQGTAGKKDDTVGHKVDIYHGTEGAGGGTMERASGPHTPP